MNATISKIAIVGTRVVTTPEEAKEAAADFLSWYGDSEADREPPLAEVSAVIDPATDEETGEFKLRPRFGEMSNQYYDGDEVIGTYPDEASADKAAAAHNEAALQSILEGVEWRDLPKPVSFVWFSGCRHGNYPQRRTATITATLAEGGEIEATGYGDARYLRETHSHEALSDAVDKLIAQLAEA